MNPANLTHPFRLLKIPVALLAAAATLGLAHEPEAFAAQIIKGPYLQNVTTSSVVVMWETDVAAPGLVQYGVAGPTEWYLEDTTSRTIHEMTLPSLSANSRYYYQVSSGTAQSTTNSFWTAPNDEITPFRFAIYGDTRSFPVDHAAVINSIVPHEPDFVLHVGDFVNNGRTYSEWGPQYFTPAAPLLKNTPLFTVPGNHEYSGTEQIWYYDFFSTPANGSTQNREHWYAFNYGNARFIALNACEGGDAFTPGTAQYQWLTNEFNSPEFKASRWQFVWMHNPPYTAVERDNAVNINLRTYLVPLFEQYGVDVVFSGDDHFYRHSLRNGIHYIITGGGGAPLHDIGTQTPGATLVYAEKTFEHCIVDLTSTSLEFYAARTNGAVIDSFSLSHISGPAVPTGLTATPGNTQVTLNWNASAGAAGYYVKRASVSGGPYTPVGTVTGTSYVDTGLANETAYYYVVSAFNAEGESANSAEASATPVCAAPSAPINLKATAANTQVTLTWTASSGATSYKVKRATSRKGPFAQIGTSSSPSYTDINVSNGQTYYYIVTAVNACGESANSITAFVTVKAPRR